MTSWTPLDLRREPHSDSRPAPRPLHLATDGTWVKFVSDALDGPLSWRIDRIDSLNWFRMFNVISLCFLFERWFSIAVPNFQMVFHPFYTQLPGEFTLRPAIKIVVGVGTFHVLYLQDHTNRGTPFHHPSSLVFSIKKKKNMFGFPPLCKPQIFPLHTINEHH